MCGRARLSSDVSEIKLVFRIPPERPTPNFPPSWNVAPTDPLPVVRFNPKNRQRSLDMMRWGLVPYWAKDIKVGFANINAKAEGIERKPAFGKAFERRRCLVPADNFYEWKKTANGKQPYALALADRGIMALAGLSSAMMMSPRLTPTRNTTLCSSDVVALRSAIPRCTATAQATASTTLGNSMRMPSPVVLTMRPLCSAIFGSMSSRRCARSRERVPASSCPMRRL
jgi:putative SOS response-associated peptidase YedK